MLDNDMLKFKTELAGNPNLCIIEINKQKFQAVLASGAEVSLNHTRIYSLKEKPKLKKQNAFLQSVKGDSFDLDECASLKYEIGREKLSFLCST